MTLEKIIIDMKDKLYNYGNTEAHNTIKKLMLRGEKLNIGFFNEAITNNACAWIESKSISASKYIIFEDNFNWLMNYLINGETEDIDAKPFGIEGLEENEGDFQLDVLKAFIKNEIALQFVPLSLDRSEFVSAISTFNHGKVMFKVKRTRELLKYLREHDILLF